MRTTNTYTVAGNYSQPLPGRADCICCAGKGYPGHRFGTDIIGEDGQIVPQPGQPLEMIAHNSPDGTTITVTIETEEPS